ncbi:MAG: M48 family metallopeptidase [Bacteroidales bacterium]
MKSSRTNLIIKMHQIVVNGIPIDVVRKAIKNLHLAVYPPEGRVRIATPLNVDDEAVRLFAISKMAWIKKNQAKYINQQRQPKRKYISGESHYFNGQRYILNVVHHTGNPKVSIKNKKYIELLVKPDYTQEQRENVLTNWYRKTLKEQIPALIEKWQRVIGVDGVQWEVKKMKTKWGTCNREAKRIWLNLELAKKPERCLEYIIVHEIIHILERNHTERFVAIMDKTMPQWREHKKELNQFPLAHEVWSY